MGDKVKCELCNENESEMDFSAVTAVGIVHARLCLSCFGEYSDDFDMLVALIGKRKSELPDVFDWLDKLPTDATIDELYGDDKADEVWAYLRTGSVPNA